MKVLIAEDEKTTSDMLQSLLEKNGYSIIVAGNGQEACDIMNRPDHPDLVILDWLMPVMDGLEVCSYICSIDYDIKPYIIMLTVKNRKMDIIEGLDTGADDYLPKPYDPDELRARLDVGRRVIELKKDLAIKMNELAESREKFKSIVENANDIIYTFGDGGVFDYVSPNWTDILGHNTDDITGQSFELFVHPDDVEKCRNFLEYVISNGRSSGIEYRVFHKDGTWRWHTTNASLIKDGKTGKCSFLGVARDITERKLTEERIRSLLTEKEILLKEIHHRIKNNMNTIRGLLSLQAANMTEESAVVALNEAGSRIQSMLMLYDKLYSSDNYNDLSFRSYFSSLIDDIVSNFPNYEDVDVVKDIEDFKITVNMVQPLGIIVNELITNAMKYAFPGGERGELKIVSRVDGENVKLVIEDNGVGMPDAVSLDGEKGFGLNLVFMLIEQIGGNITLDRGSGSRFTMEFHI